jgi:hypothetical protein
VTNDPTRPFERAGRKMDEAFDTASDRVQKELTDAIKYLNDEVVPKVRSGSTQALRTAAEKLAKLAEYMEQQKK